MNLRTFASCLLLAAFSSCLTSCFSSSEVSSRNEASVGRQLTDLETARQQGLVTEKEYVRLKKTIIKRNS